MTMTVTFWGTRGSIPTPSAAKEERAALARVLLAAEPEDVADAAAVEAFIAGGCRGALATRYGGDTACVEVRDAGGDRLLIDLGSGARVFATSHMRANGPRLDRPLDILLSHLHWDHIQGLPFFGLAYVPGNTLRVRACHDGVEDALRAQMSQPFFPVPFDVFGADISVERMTPDVEVDVSGFSVTPFALPHPGGAYAYRISRGGRTVIYASDAEHKPETVSDANPYVAFARGADVLIFDAQYSLAESVSAKEDWGHSSNLVGVELALLAGVRELVFVHHDPLATDAQLDQVLADSRRYEEIIRDGRPPVTVRSAWCGQELTLP